MPYPFINARIALILGRREPLLLDTGDRAVVDVDVPSPSGDTTRIGSELVVVEVAVAAALDAVFWSMLAAVVEAAAGVMFNIVASKDDMVLCEGEKMLFTSSSSDESKSTTSAS